MPGEPDLPGRNAADAEHGDVGVAPVDGEPGYERVPDAGADETLDDATVVGPENDVGLEAFAAQVRFAAVCRDAIGDERKPGDLASADPPLTLRQLGADGRQEHIRVDQHVALLDGGLDRIGDEREVDLPADELLGQKLVVCLDELDLDRRPALHVEAHHRRDHAYSDALERGDAKGAGVALGQRVQVGFGSTHRGGGPHRVAEQSIAGLGRRYRPAATRSFEQPHLRGALENRDLLADRGLRVAEAAARGREGTGLDDRLERRQVAELDPEQSISDASRIVHHLVFYLSIGYDDPECMFSSLRRRDRPLLAVAALAFASAVADAALLPVLPTLQEGFELSGVQVGALLSAATIVTLLASVPIGLLAGRLGSRRLLLASAALLPASLVVQASAGGLAMLMAGRALFGLSFAILWSIAPAVAAGAGRGAAGAGRLIAAAGAGWLVGPVLSGAVTEVWGYPTAFATIAVLTLPLVAVLARDRSAESRVPAARLRDAIAAAGRERALAGAMLVTALLGVVTGVSGLLAPLVLADNGLTAGGIGAVIALSAVIFTASGAMSTRIPSARVNVRVVGGVAAILAATFLIPMVSFSTFAVIGFLVLGAGARAVLNTVVYALARSHVPTEALATPIVGVMNVTWAATALAAPLAAGVALSAGGAKWAFVATAITGFAVAVWMLLPQPRAAYA